MSDNNPRNTTQRAAGYYEPSAQLAQSHLRSFVIVGADEYDTVTDSPGSSQTVTFVEVKMTTEFLET